MNDRDLMQQAQAALFAMLTHMGLDEDEWNKPTFDQCRKAEADLRERLAQPGSCGHESCDCRAYCKKQQTAPGNHTTDEQKIANGLAWLAKLEAMREEFATPTEESSGAEQPAQQQALKQALEALEWFDKNATTIYEIQFAHAAALHLRAAIEQAEKQPCKYPKCPYPCPDLPDCKDAEKQEPKYWEMPDGKIVDKWGLQFYNGVEGMPLYTTPPAAQPAPVQDIGVEQDERVFARIAARKNRDAAHKEAAQRQWVGLTDEELELLNDCGDTDSYKYARAIEAKLREKNGGGV